MEAVTNKSLIVNAGVKGTDWEYIEKNIKPLDLFDLEYLKIDQVFLG